MPSAIISCEPSHFPFMAALHGASFARGWGEEELRQMLSIPGTYALIAIEKDQPAGFILYRVLVDESELLTMAVDKACRRCGLGRALLDSALKEAAHLGAATMFLEVARQNAAAQQLYKSADFHQISTRPGYYHNADGSPDDALILRRETRG